jgi:hypothetical protein
VIQLHPCAGSTICLSSSTGSDGQAKSSHCYTSQPQLPSPQQHTQCCSKEQQHLQLTPN